MKILLAITALMPPPWGDTVLPRAAAAAKVSGADLIRIITVGERILPPNFVSDQWIHIGLNPGQQEADRIQVLAAMKQAEHLGCDWIVKAVGDCIHFVPGWARAWCEAAKDADCIMLADWHPELRNQPGTVLMPQTKVFAAQREFLEATWPKTRTDFIERDWDTRIMAAHLWPRVHIIPEAETEYLAGGGQMYFRPRESALKFEHVHA